MGILDYLVRIINLLSQVLNGTLTIQQAVQRLLDSIEKVALEHAPYRIETVTLSTNLETIDPDHGLAALKHALDGIGLAIIAMGNPQQTAVPVTLPTVPPAGYGSGPSVDAIWTYVPPAQAQTTRSLLTSAGHIWTVMTGLEAGVHIPGYPWYCFAGPFDEPTFGDARPGDLPVIDPTTIHASDTTPYVWLNRAYPGLGFYNHGGGVAGAVSGSDHYTYIVDLTVQQFQQLKSWVLNGMFGPKMLLPPVWPGVSGVSLLTPHDLEDGLIITEAMDGVLVAITSVSPRTQNIPYGTVQAYGHIGSLTFGDDLGDYEEFQYLTFANQVYCPRFLKRASSVAVRVKSGLVGTVTPWTLA